MNRQLTITLCSVALLGALGLIWFQLRPAVIRIPRAETVGTQTGLGAVLGAETAKIVPNSGRVVVVTAANPVPLQQRSPALWTAFAGELRKHNIQVTVVETPLNAWESGSLPADRAAFRQLLEQQTGADALVFLIDLLEWGRAREAIPQHGVPPLIAVDNLKERTKVRSGGYFTAGLLVALISTRHAPRPATPPPPQTPRDWFDKFYQIYTPQNYETLPE